MFHVIDDDDRICKLLKALVIKAGYNAICFESAEKYIEHLNSQEFQKPTAVLSDVVMPGIDGFELALEIRKKIPFQKITLISATPYKGYDNFASEQLCNLVKKPFHPKDFISMIQALALCEEVHGQDNNGYVNWCEFGFNHRCPF